MAKADDVLKQLTDDDIIDIIPYGNTQVVVEDTDGFEYLGRNYKLEEVKRC